jgi:predicted RNA-binding Zn-ribbon protein involved in translation (DUF1610 family)
MPIKFSCPACGKQTQAPDEMAGKQARCPICKQVIEVPKPDFDPDATAAAYQPAATPPAATGEQEERMPCPMCGEMIVRNAAKCRFCGEIFDPTLRRTQKTASAADSEMSVVEWFVAILCSGIGCIFGIVYMIQGKPKGLKMFLVSICMAVVWTFVRIVIQAGLQGR